MNSFSLKISFVKFIIINSINDELQSKLILLERGFDLSVIAPLFDIRKYKFSFSVL